MSLIAIVDGLPVPHVDGENLLVGSQIQALDGDGGTVDDRFEWKLQAVLHHHEETCGLLCLAVAVHRCFFYELLQFDLTPARARVVTL